jgi:hypothetical protein
MANEKNPSHAETDPAPRVRTYWNEQARNLLQAEMSRRGASYKHLVRLLEADGIKVSEESLMTRVNRGTFPLAFFLQVVRALGGSAVIDISHAMTTAAATETKPPPR